MTAPRAFPPGETPLEHVANALQIVEFIRDEFAGLEARLREAHRLLQEHPSDADRPTTSDN